MRHLQFPFCYLATDKDIALVEKCKKGRHGIYRNEGIVRRSDHELCG